MIQAQRRQVWQFYDAALADWAEGQGVTRPYIPHTCEQAYHMYYLLTPSLAYRTALIDHLKTHGIQSVFHYVPLHLSKMGRKMGGQEGDCPVTESVSDRLLRLPFFNDLTEREQTAVIETIGTFKPTATDLVSG